MLTQIEKLTFMGDKVPIITLHKLDSTINSTNLKKMARG